LLIGIIEGGDRMTVTTSGEVLDVQAHVRSCTALCWALTHAACAAGIARSANGGYDGQLSGRPM